MNWDNSHIGWLLSLMAFVAVSASHCFVCRKSKTRIRELEMGLAREKAERRQAEMRTRLQRDMTTAMGSAAPVKESLQRLLEMLVQVHHVDCGGVYLLRKGVGGFDLVASIGLAPSFVDSCSHIEPDSPRAMIIKSGRVQCFTYNAGADSLEKPEAMVEGLVAPLFFEGKIVGALNLGAHFEGGFSPDTLAAVESAALLIGGVAGRISRENEARELESHADRMIDFLPVGILLADDRLNVVRANGAAARLAGGAVAGMLHQKPGNALGCVHSRAAPEGCGFSPRCSLCELRKSMESVVAVGTSIRGLEYVLRSEARNGGSPLSVRLNAEPLMIGDRQHVMVTLEEIAGNRSGSGNTEGA